MELMLSFPLSLSSLLSPLIMPSLILMLLHNLGPGKNKVKIKDIEETKKKRNKKKKNRDSWIQCNCFLYTATTNILCRIVGEMIANQDNKREQRWYREQDPGGGRKRDATTWYPTRSARPVLKQ